MMLEIVAYALLFVFLFLEPISPFLPINKKNRWTHVLNNISIKVLNLAISYSLLSIIFPSYFEMSSSFGLLNLLNLPYWLETLLAILLYDLFGYFWHVFSHKTPFFWRFHRAHHTDIYVDASTGIRKHFMEVVFATVLFVFFIVPVFGIKLEQLIIYKLILIFVEIFNHANIALPKNLDNLISLIIVSPNMHRVHHSDIKVETDSNYGDIFPFWDRIFKTFVYKENVSEINFGLKEFTDPKWQTFIGILKTPLA